MNPEPVLCPTHKIPLKFKDFEINLLYPIEGYYPVYKCPECDYQE